MINFTVYQNRYTVSYLLHCIISFTLNRNRYTVSYPLHCIISVTLNHVRYTVSYPLHCIISVTLNHNRYTVSYPLHCIITFLQASACNTDTTQTQPHQISNTQRTKNKTTDVVTQQHSRKLLRLDILMSETC